MFTHRESLTCGSPGIYLNINPATSKRSPNLEYFKKTKPTIIVVLVNCENGQGCPQIQTSCQVKVSREK